LGLKERRAAIGLDDLGDRNQEETDQFGSEIDRLSQWMDSAVPMSLASTLSASRVQLLGGTRAFKCRDAPLPRLLSPISVAAASARGSTRDQGACRSVACDSWML
jgi:hypothetical protein